MFEFKLDWRLKVNGLDRASHHPCVRGLALAMSCHQTKLHQLQLIFLFGEIGALKYVYINMALMTLYTAELSAMAALIVQFSY